MKSLKIHQNDTHMPNMQRQQIRQQNNTQLTKIIKNMEICTIDRVHTGFLGIKWWRLKKVDKKFQSCEIQKTVE